MTKWDGKSKGTVLGYKIFVFCIRYLGIGFAYLLLRFVALYFVFFSFKGTKASYYYFRKRWHFSIAKSLYKVYQSYYVFGQTLIDKIAMSAGMRDHYTFAFEAARIRDIVSAQKGGFLISGHLGNFELSRFIFQQKFNNAKINMIILDNEHAAIKNYLQNLKSNAKLNFILVKADMSHIFEIHEALSNHELICMTGDRFMEGMKYMEAPFMGATAKFPAGTFLLGSRMKVPVIFTYMMKAKHRKYELYAYEAEFKYRDPKSLLNAYIKSMEKLLNKYPLQWFNYFDFWEDYS